MPFRHITAVMGQSRFFTIVSRTCRAATAVILLRTFLFQFPAAPEYGAAPSLAIITSAILSHPAKLGIAFPLGDDHSELFALTVVVIVCSLPTLQLHRGTIPSLRAGISDIEAGMERV